MTDEELIRTYFANKHILQSPGWGEFKTLAGTRTVTAGGSQFTLHRLPLTPWNVGYAPKIKPEDLNLAKLHEGARKEGCLFVKIDVPHAPQNYQLPATNYQLTPGKSVFAQSTILMDLTKTNEELLAGMHEKTRYNLRLAQKKGVTVVVYTGPTASTRASTRSHLVDGAVEGFIALQKETAERQKFFLHSDHYYKTCFEILSAHGLAYLLEAQLPSSNQRPTTHKTAASWMLFRYGDVLYYPYGESNYEMRSYMPSNLLMWEAIQLGKRLGCKVFDLWGAASNPDDETDPWHGFTRFKLAFGGKFLRLAATYDLILNPTLYHLFNRADDWRWQVLRAIRH